MSLVNYFQLTQCYVHLSGDYLDVVKSLNLDNDELEHAPKHFVFKLKVKSFVAVHGNNLVQLYFHNGEMIVLPTGAIFAVTKC